MAKAVSAIELAKEVSANPRTFRYYLARNWGERPKYQRWLFTRAQANKIKAAYRASPKYGRKRAIKSPETIQQDAQQLKLKNFSG